MSLEEYAEQFGYSLARRAGGLVFFSGVVGMDAEGQAPADPATQYALAFESLREVMRGEGVEPGDLVDLLTFHTHFPEHLEAFGAAKAAFLGGAKPTWTAIGVAALGTPETLVEIRAIAESKR